MVQETVDEAIVQEIVNEVIEEAMTRKEKKEAKKAARKAARKEAAEKKAARKAARKMDKKRKKQAMEDKVCFLSERGPKPVGPYSTACISGGFVFLSGVIGLDPAENKLVEGGLEAQAGQVLKNIGTILEEMGLEFKNVIKTNVFMKDIEKFKAFNEMYAAYFTENCPARSAVEVSNLPVGAEIEVELIAAVSEKGIQL